MQSAESLNTGATVWFRGGGMVLLNIPQNGEEERSANNTWEGGEPHYSMRAKACLHMLALSSH